MKLTALTLLAAALSNTTPIESYTEETPFSRGDWSFWYSDNMQHDHAMCSLSVPARPDPSSEILHIKASPGKPIVAFTRGGLSKGGIVSWEVDGMQAAHFAIGERREMTPIGLRALAALSAGKKLEYLINDEHVDAFPLNGASAAIDKFMDCWTGSTNPQKANRVVGSNFIHGKYNDLAIMDDEQASVAPSIRRDIYDDGLGAYFVPVADDGKVVTKGYMFVFQDTENVSHLVAVSTLTRNAAGEVETDVDDELAGSCIESDSNILCYGVGYAQVEYRLDFDKTGLPYTLEQAKKNIGDATRQEATAALAKDVNNPFRKDAAKPADDPSPDELGTTAADEGVHGNSIQEQHAAEHVAGEDAGYANLNRNIMVEAFGEFTSMILEGDDFTDIAGKKLVRTVNHFTNPETHVPIGQGGVKVITREKQGYHYQFEIKNRFDRIGEDSGTKVKFNLENVHEDNGTLRSTITSVQTISGSRAIRNMRAGGFGVEQGYCVENEPLEADTSTPKTVECKGISTKGDRFGFTFVRDTEFAPKITEWDVRKEKEAYEATRKMIEDKERKVWENMERLRD